MDEGQERSLSPDKETQIIDDDDDSPTDDQDLWLTGRNEEDNMFERTSEDTIPIKRNPQTVQNLERSFVIYSLFVDF